MTNLSEFTFLSSDGKTQLHGMLWEPEGVAVRAVLQICHGVAEHIARYDGFARALNEQGIVVAGHDHLGHGKSLPEGGTPVYFGQGNTWNTVVDDIYVLHQRLKQRYPDVPLCIMGHSMGSFLTRTYLIRYPGTVKAAVIMGTGWQPQAAITGGLAPANAIAAVSGENATSELVTELAFGSYNKAFEPKRTKYDSLTRDEAVVDAYAKDPLCTFTPTTSLFRDMMYGLSIIGRQRNLAKMNKDLPVYFMSGDKDPVGGDGVQVAKVYSMFVRAGMKDVFYKFYKDGRHEMLNESNRDEVYRDILNWLFKKIG